MEPPRSGSGREHLERKSGLARLFRHLPPMGDILIIEDEAFDADRLAATLHLMFGYDLLIRRAATLGRAIDAVIEKKPQLVFLDDVLKPADDASFTIPFLRRAAYEGPIVVVSGQVTRQRSADLLAAGATDVVHKDDVDSVRLAEALERVFRTHIDATRSG